MKQHYDIDALKTGIPRPYYLIDDTIEIDDVDIENQARSMRSHVLFPSDDPDVVDRDHVNIATHQLASWNAAHMLCALHNIEKPKALVSTARPKHMTLPDETLVMEAMVQITRDRKRLIEGVLTTQFYGGEERKLYQEIVTQFFAKKKK